MRDRLNAITDKIIGAGVDVHKALGPGLLESAYETCLCLELIERGVSFERQKPVPLVYKNRIVDCAYRDLLVEREVVVEIKAVEKFTPVHLAQMLTYLRVLKLPLGLIINFNVKYLPQGIRRVANGSFDG
ncbi:MAG TPA: GxxExxY protein [Vicinamibacterales bacterium]|nr:GxxExxY protein [Vicinamibacterales bacterium]